MREIDESTAADYAIEHDLFVARSSIRCDWLSGGVSNAVFLLTDVASGQSLILKQAREKLRTAAEWRSRLDRIWREVAALRVIASVVPHGEVPEVLFEDHENYLFAMTAVPAGHVVWKHLLLQGESRPDVYVKLGSFLGRVHAGTWDGVRVPADLRDQQVFDELRLDPYYRWTARKHPVVAAELLDLVESTSSRRDCLTLADFSPKNILIIEDRVTVLDFETAHLGDPAFDLGFFITHLVLKSIHLPATRGDILSGVLSFLGAYHHEFPAPGASTEIEARSQRHLAACLLARIDGKSPVDYLSGQEQVFVRSFAIPLLKSPPADWPDFQSRLEVALRNSLLSSSPIDS